MQQKARRKNSPALRVTMRFFVLDPAPLGLLVCARRLSPSGMNVYAEWRDKEERVQRRVRRTRGPV